MTVLRFLLLWAFALAFIPAHAFADAGPAADAGAPDAAVVVVSAPPAAIASALAVIGDPDAPIGTPDVTDAAKGAVEAVRAAMDRPTLLSVVFGVSAALWLLLALLRAYGPRWISPRVIRLSTLIAAPVLTFASAWGAGMPWFDAVILAGGGPGALLLNELGRGLNPKA